MTDTNHYAYQCAFSIVTMAGNHLLETYREIRLMRSADEEDVLSICTDAHITSRTLLAAFVISLCWLCCCTF